jgi:hypothetical protein
MWWVLNAHASKLDDIEATLAAYRGCSASPLPDMCAPHLPWWDRFAVSISLGHLMQYEPGGLEPDSDVRSAPSTCTYHMLCVLMDMLFIVLQRLCMHESLRL